MGHWLYPNLRVHELVVDEVHIRGIVAGDQVVSWAR